MRNADCECGVRKLRRESLPEELWLNTEHSAQRLTLNLSSLSDSFGRNGVHLYTFSGECKQKLLEVKNRTQKP